MSKLLIIIGLFVVTGAVFAANPGDEVVVVYNTRMPGSKDVAEHYAERRQVPSSQVFGFAMSTNEDMSRAEFETTLEKPLAKALESKKIWHIGSEIFPATSNSPAKLVWRVMQTKIRYAALCYGVPLRIEEDSTVKESISDRLKPELRRNEAAVDSELALLPCMEQHYPLTGPLKNSFFTLTNSAWFNPTNGLLMVTRLDGPSASIARGLVDKAMEAESNGLCGRAYFDLRNLETNSPYRVGDDWILGAGKICQYYGGYETIFDNNPGTFTADFPMSQIAIYCGWYDENVSGPFAQKEVEFMPGAFAYHLHSFSAVTLRSTTECWAGPLLAKGAAATMGCVAEPYIGTTPDMSVFCGRWVAMGFTYGEAAYACQETLSWQTTVIGDPLYQPFAKSLEAQIDEQQRRHAKTIDWLYLRAVNLGLMHGKTPEEMAISLEGLSTTKESAVLSEKLADLYVAAGKPSSAIEAFANALKLHPSPLQRVRVRLDLADQLTAQNQQQKATADLKALLDEDPDYPGRPSVEKKIQDLAGKEAASAAQPGATP